MPSNPIKQAKRLALSEDLAARLLALRLFAQRMTHRVNRRSVMVEASDLVQCGVLAYLEADAVRGHLHVALECTPTIRMRGAMIDCVRANDWLSRDLRRQVGRSERCVLRLRQTLGRIPTNREIAVSLQLTLEQYQKIVSDYRAHRRMRGDASAVIDRIAASDGSPLQILLDQSRNDTLALAIASLPRREAQVIKLYYGRGYNLHAISAIYGVSASRVSQLLTHAKWKLHRRMVSFVDETDQPRPRSAYLTERRYDGAEAVKPRTGVVRVGNA
jgi:RNA polymerase sigma factor FliA